jgi:hypothetical protein
MNVTPTIASPDRDGPAPKRVLCIIPNFRRSPGLAKYRPLTPREKHRIATLNSFDRGTVALGVSFAAEAQLTNSNPSFGQVAGNSTEVAISMAYYPENRDAADGVSKLGSQLGVHVASNIVKEFRPDFERKSPLKHKSTGRWVILNSTLASLEAAS